MAEFNIYSNAKLNSVLPLKVKLIYKDDFNKEYQEEQTLNIKLYSSDEARKLGFSGDKSISKSCSSFPKWWW